MAVRDGAAGGGKAGRADEGGEAGRAAGAAAASGTVKSGSADGDKAGAADSADIAEGGKAAAKSGAAGGGKADQATAVFGAVKASEDKAGTKDDQAPAKADAAEKTPAAAGTGKAAASGTAKADQATAVFGAVKAPKGGADSDADSDAKADAKAEPKAASWGAGASGNGKPKEDARLKAAVAAWVADAEDKDDAKAAASGDQPTELIEAPKAPKDGKDAKAKASADQPTQAIKAPANPDSESERTSQFVPLKKDDAPAAKPLKAPKPEVKAESKAEAKPKAAPPAPPKPAAGTPAPAKAPAEPPAPLDLLAQLTNTPPPPETPVRTAVRRVKIWTPLVVLLGIIFVVVQAMRPLPAPKLAIAADKSSFAFGGATPPLTWPSEGQAIVDVDGLGRVGSYGEMKPLPIGSVAKVMTTYIILRDHPLKKGDNGQLIDVDQKAEDDFTNGVKEKESVVEVHKGQKISEKEALEAVMLPSANNVARLLARWDAGGEEAFIKKMNDTAKELGMTNTTYTDASGLMESTVSTAEDQVKLGKRAMQDPTFREISKMTQYTSTTASGTGSGVEYQKTQANFNKLVPAFGVVGIKTGSTTKAGGNLLFAAEKKVGDSTQLIIGAVFGQHKSPIIDTATDYSKQLILAVGKELTTSTVVKKGEVVGHVDDGLGGTTPVVATKDLTAVGWPGLKVDLKITAGDKTLPHTAKAGTQVGELTAGGGMGEVKVPVALQKDLVEPSFGSKVTRLG
ncbi:D-alanyl-D-alanine carboxypeptidase [Streptomyces sp. NPDC001262]|uniref:D-alanyl-D-alanine carboxypeptidase n=1 Tax=Streptomyces sp. NPDC001262 TaxID=3364552 RepID=UPI00369B9CC0